MVAAAFGSPQAMRLLLASGADVRAVSSAGVTALHWAAPSEVKVQLLLEAGADVNVVTQLGRTPLLIAASSNGAASRSGCCWQKGAKVTVTDGIGMTPLTAAALVNDTEVVKLLVAKGAPVEVPSANGAAATPLMAAATNGNLETVRLLLARGANPNAVSADSANKVKNGPIAFGRMTALHFAVLSGNPDVVQRLMTPMRTSIARRARHDTAHDGHRHGSPRSAHRADAGGRWRQHIAALDRGRDRDRLGAGSFSIREVLAALKLRPETPIAAASTGTTLVAAHAQTPRAAVERSLPPLREASANMLPKGGCVACHAQPLTGIAVNLAKARGWTTASAEAESRRSSRAGGQRFGLIQLARGRRVARRRAVPDVADGQQTRTSRATDAVVHYVAAKQRQDGSWEGIGGSARPDAGRQLLPHGLGDSGPDHLRHAGASRRVRRARQRAAGWLADQTPLSTEDRVDAAAGAALGRAPSPGLRAARVRELLAQQRADGGWAQTPYLQSDAYATGQVLYTLRQLEVRPRTKRCSAALRFCSGRRPTMALACDEPRDEDSSRISRAGSRTRTISGSRTRAAPGR